MRHRSSSRALWVLTGPVVLRLMGRVGRLIFSVLVIAHAGACGDPSHADSPTRTAVGEIAKLPAPIRERFSTPAGQTEMQRALDDRSLLVVEARRRGLNERDDVRQALLELEERLAVKALLEEERRTLRASDDELRAYFDAHKTEFRLPERRQTERILVVTRGDRAKAEQHAQGLRRRIDAGEDFAALVNEGDGAERVQGGRLGPIDRQYDDPLLVQAVFGAAPGKVIGPVECREGFALIRVTTVLPSTEPSFESVRGIVEGRFQPTLERRAFEQLIQRLRTGGPT